MRTSTKSKVDFVQCVSIVLGIIMLAAGSASAADITITGDAGPQTLTETQNIIVKSGGSVSSDALGIPAINGSTTNQGGNVITVESNASVTASETVNNIQTIRLYGTLTDDTKIGLAGGGSLPQGASNILNLQAGSLVSTQASNGAVEVGSNNLVTASGTIQTTKNGSDCIIVRANNNDITATGDFSTVLNSSDGIWGGTASNNLVRFSGTIHTTGDTSDGIDFSEGNENALLVSGSITTTGLGSDGLEVGSHSTITITGALESTGESSHGIYAYLEGNISHISGSISATGINAHAIHSGQAGYSGESNIYHLLSGASLTGGIHNADSDDNATSYLTFGYAKDSTGQAILTQADQGFALTVTDSITSDSSGNWDGYFAGGTTTLDGDTNAFHTINVGGDTFAPLTLFAGEVTETDIARISGAAATLNVSKAITTDGSIHVGTGSVYTLSGTHTHSGAAPTLDGTLTLQGGTFLSDNGFGSLGAGGMVRGSGTMDLKGTTWTTGGNGGSIRADGALVIANGDLVVSAKDTAAVGIAPDGNTSSITVASTADFTGATVSVDAAGGVPNTDYELIQAGTLTLAEGDVTFSDNSGIFDFIFSVENNTLTVTTGDTQFAAIAAAMAPAHLPFATILDNTYTSHSAELQGVYQGLAMLPTTSDVSQAMIELQPVTNTTALIHAGVQHTNMAMGYLFDTFRIPAFPGGNDEADTRPGAGTENNMAPIPTTGWRAFAGLYGGFGDQDGEQGLVGYDYDWHGLLCGGEYTLSPQARIGLLLGYAKGDSDLDGGGGSSEDEMYRFGPYASISKDIFFFDTAATFGVHNIDTWRDIGFLDTRITGDRTAHDFSWLNRIGCDMVFGNKMTLTPSYILTYTRVSDSHYTEDEDPSGAHLMVDTDTSDSLVHELNLKAGILLHLDDHIVFHPEAWCGWQYEQLDPGGEVTAAFAAMPSEHWSLNALEPDDNRVRIGASATMHIDGRHSFVARYDRVFRDDGYDASVSLGINIQL
ncbi:autotransporter family protein [Desulfoluna spongiiphila]|uniref:autotransporter family protein n=1 Tax=Desulfoluna spongiiphila TaxID=419481 RepID=UPI001259A4EF|nr:autotransporter outer membrane beta-barrel domain-containing protein [Desulfoluna spongiiphila]VVS94165.1 autotransporter beta-domain [Desulfoluna spongiiphila]